MSRLLKLAIASIVLALPTHVGAQVLITEVMYDLPGSDTGPGGEWVEVYNSGTQEVDLTAWVLFEADTNHKLLPHVGSLDLLPDQYAVIVNSPDLFLAGYPSFSGTVIDSSFSLANEGETLALKDGSGEVRTEFVYSAAEGAAGDGNSLNRVGGSLRAVLPTPGARASSEVAVVASSDDASSQSTVLSGASTAKITPAKQAVAVGGGSAFALKNPGNRTAIAGAAEFYDVEPVLPKSVREGWVSYYWNFGNGVTNKNRRPFHAYDYPGSYVVTVEAYARSERAQTRFTVKVVPPELSLEVLSTDAISITNHSEGEIDLSRWSLRAGGSHFVFPEPTVLLPEASVTFDRKVTGLVALSSGLVDLLYPSGEVVNLVSMDHADAVDVDREEGQALDSESLTQFVMSSEIHSDGGEKKQPLTDDLIAAPVVAVPQGDSPSLYYGLLGLLVLVSVGLVVVLVLRTRGDVPLVVQGYEIVEDREDGTTDKL